MLATLTALSLPALTAAADAGDPTARVAVDDDGVTIRIDTTLTGAGEGSGAAGPQCRYRIAEIRKTSIHLQLVPPPGAELHVVDCPGYVDLLWLPTGLDGLAVLPVRTPAPAGEVDPYELAMTARDQLPVPTPPIRANPERGLTGLESWFWLDGYDGQPLSRSLSAFGLTVEVNATPQKFRWDFGDGNHQDSTSPGQPYPQRSAIAHTYQQAGLRQVTCDYTYRVRYRVNGGPWQPLPPIRRTVTISLPVVESRAVLTE